MENRLLKKLWTIVEANGSSKEEVQGGSRRSDVVDIRVAMAILLHLRVGMTQKQVSKVIGHKDHTTTNKYINAFEHRYDNIHYKHMMEQFTEAIEEYENQEIVTEIRRIWHNNKGNKLENYPTID